MEQIGLAMQDGYRIEALRIEDAPQAQPLFEACADYFVLESGEPPAADAAEVEFHATPPGRTVAEKRLFGLSDDAGGLVGVINSDVDWPESGCWWIALLLIHPAHRGTGVAQDFIDAFLSYASESGAKRVELAVFAENERAERFWEGCGFVHIRSTEPRRIGGKTHVLRVMRRAIG